MKIAADKQRAFQDIQIGDEVNITLHQVTSFQANWTGNCLLKKLDPSKYWSSSTTPVSWIFTMSSSTSTSRSREHIQNLIRAGHSHISAYWISRPGLGGSKARRRAVADNALIISCFFFIHMQYLNYCRSKASSHHWLKALSPGLFKSCCWVAVSFSHHSTLQKASSRCP